MDTDNTSLGILAVAAAAEQGLAVVEESVAVRELAAARQDLPHAVALVDLKFAGLAC